MECFCTFWKGKKRVPPRMPPRVPPEAGAITSKRICIFLRAFTSDKKTNNAPKGIAARGGTRVVWGPMFAFCISSGGLGSHVCTFWSTWAPIFQFLMTLRSHLELLEMLDLRSLRTCVVRAPSCQFAESCQMQAHLDPCHTPHPPQASTKPPHAPLAGGASPSSC